MRLINNKRYLCSLDYGMDLIRGKWKAVILCHLHDQPTRFLELQRLLKEVSQKVLTEKLKELEQDKLIEKIVFPEIPPRVEYKLTDDGLELFKVLNQLQNWSDQYIKNRFEN